MYAAVLSESAPQADPHTTECSGSSDLLGASRAKIKTEERRRSLSFALGTRDALE